MENCAFLSSCKQTSTSSKLSSTMRTRIVRRLRPARPRIARPRCSRCAPRWPAFGMATRILTLQSRCGIFPAGYWNFSGHLHFISSLETITGISCVPDAAEYPYYPVNRCRAVFQSCKLCIFSRGIRVVVLVKNIYYFLLVAVTQEAERAHYSFSLLHYSWWIEKKGNFFVNS